MRRTFVCFWFALIVMFMASGCHRGMTKNSGSDKIDAGAGQAGDGAGQAGDGGNGGNVVDAAITCQNDDDCPQYYYCRKGVCLPGCEPTIAAGQPGSCTAICSNGPFTCRMDHTCVCLEIFQPGTSGERNSTGCIFSSTNFCLSLDFQDSEEQATESLSSSNFQLHSTSLP